jgi:hypothetical protein
MAKASKKSRRDFEQALGETFSEHVCPPVPFEDASPHECCEVVWSVVGDDVTPARLAALTRAEIASLAKEFGDYFESDAPAVKQVKEAIAQTLARWPVGSLGEKVEQ